MPADVAQTSRETCDAGTRTFGSQYGDPTLVTVLLITVPALVGLFWGAPLVSREVDTAPPVRLDPGHRPAGTGPW